MTSKIVPTYPVVVHLPGPEQRVVSVANGLGVEPSRERLVELEEGGGYTEDSSASASSDRAGHKRDIARTANAIALACVHLAAAAVDLLTRIGAIVEVGSVELHAGLCVKGPV
jgi:hypothetical protein